jgi:hypothetical protein
VIVIILAFIGVVIAYLSLAYDAGWPPFSDKNLEPLPTIAPGPTATLQPASPPIQEPPPTPAPTLTTPTPTYTPTPTPTLDLPPPAMTPSTVIASDVPGTPLAVGEEVSSIVDINTKPKDVYAIELVAGQEVVFTLSGPSKEIYVQLANPDTQSFDGPFTYAIYQDLPVDPGWRRTFLPAVSGTYYLSVSARHSSQPYTVSVAIN